jgi:hypothetical protein
MRFDLVLTVCRKEHFSIPILRSNSVGKMQYMCTYVTSAQAFLWQRTYVPQTFTRYQFSGVCFYDMYIYMPLERKLYCYRTLTLIHLAYPYCLPFFLLPTRLIAELVRKSTFFIFHVHVERSRVLIVISS